MSASLSTVELPVFVKKKHELDKLLKQIERASPEAVELIVATMTNNDKESGISLKTKLECAKLLIEMQLKVASEISKDNLTRQIAEIKAKGLPPPGLGVQDASRKAPALNFNDIQEV